MARLKKPSSAGPRPGGAPWWRWLITATLALGVLVALNVYFVRDTERFTERMMDGAMTPPTLAEPEVEAEILPLSDYDLRGLEAMREEVEALARRHVGSIPTGERFDLEILQEILDKAELEASDTTELKALGVALGDLLAAQHGMRWVKVSDQYGRTAALKYRSDEHLFFPITWISKRVEAGIDVDVAALYADLEDIVAKIDAAGRGA